MFFIYGRRIFEPTLSLSDLTSSQASKFLAAGMADCTTNHYQAATAVLQASELGFTNNMILQAAKDQYGIENSRATRYVPSSLKKGIIRARER